MATTLVNSSVTRDGQNALLWTEFSPKPEWKNGWKGRKRWRDQYIKQQGKCVVCGKLVSVQFMTMDHVVPCSKGGNSDWDNIQLTCEPCNHQKADSVSLCFNCRWYLKVLRKCIAWCPKTPMSEESKSCSEFCKR